MVAVAASSMASGISTVCAPADSWAVPSGGIAEAAENLEFDPALPGTEKCLRYRLPRAVDSGAGGFICQSVQFDTDTTPRECDIPCWKPDNEKPVSVPTAAREPKMEIPG